MDASKVIAQLRKALDPHRVPYKIEDLTHGDRVTVTAEISTRERPDQAGMQLIYEDGIFEVSEYQAGPRADQLHVYGEYKTAGPAVRSLLKGNRNRKPIKIY